MWTPINRDWTVKPPLGTPLRTDGHWSVQGLVGCWLFNEGAGNLVFDATKSWPNTAGSFTRDRDACVFNRLSKNFVQTKLTQNSALSPVTILTRLKRTRSALGERHFILGNRDDSNRGFSFGLYDLSTGGGNFDFTYQGVSEYITSNTLLYTGQYHDFCISVSGNVARTYYDSALESVINLGTYNTSAAPYIIGAQGPIGDYGNMDAIIKYLYVFNRALSPNEIASLSANPYQVCQP